MSLSLSACVCPCSKKKKKTAWAINTGSPWQSRQKSAHRKTAHFFLVINFVSKLSQQISLHAYINTQSKPCFILVAWWRNGRALDLRPRDRGFDSRVGAQLRNDRGQVAHTRLPSASEVTTIWRYTNLYIILLLLLWACILANITVELKRLNMRRRRSPDV